MPQNRIDTLAVILNQSNCSQHLSLHLFSFVRGEVRPATSSPPHLIVVSTLLCLLSSSSSLPPLLPSSHLSKHSPPISALASLVSSCPVNQTLLLASVACHLPSFLPVLPSVVCSSPVSLSSSSVPLSLLNSTILLLSALVILAIFVHSCFRTRAALVVVRSLARFPFRTGMPVSHKCS